MHVAQTRQLIALAVVCLLGAGVARSADGASLEEEIQAARLAHAALAARDATAEEWRAIEERYDRLVARDPRGATARNARAEFWWDRGEKERAVAEWEALEQLDPMNARVLEHLADAALEAGDVRKSAAFYTRALASDPANAACHFAFANVCFLFRNELIDLAHPNAEYRLNEALLHFAEASRLEPDNAEYLRAYAETFYSLAKPDWPAALAAWARYETLTSKKDFAYLHLARVHANMGHIGAARSFLSRVEDPHYKRVKARLEARLDAAAGGPLPPEAGDP